jgi:DNA adenine methylase
VLNRVKPGDFVYMDPPFSVSERRMFKEYDASVFEWKDIIRLRHRMDGLAKAGIPFVVSYVQSQEAEYLAKGFKVSAVSVRRNIAGFLASRTKCQELLISNLA